MNAGVGTARCRPDVIVLLIIILYMHYTSKALFPAVSITTDTTFLCTSPNTQIIVDAASISVRSFIYVNVGLLVVVDV